MSTAVIIPCFNRWDLTIKCVEALYAAAGQIGAGEVIVDNGSDKPMPMYVPHVKLASNVGFAKGCNIGAMYTDAEYLVFLNNDTEVHPGWLAPLIDAVRDLEVGIAGSKLTYPDGRIQHAGVCVDFSRPPGAEAWGVQTDEPTRDVDAVTGACLAIRRDLFWQVGGFDDGYWNGYEDVDLCLKVRAAGYRIRYVSESVVTHLESQSGPERWAKVAENVWRLRARWSDERSLRLAD